MIILECEQNSPEWDEVRLGIPTASAFENIVTTKGVRSKSRNKYLYKLAGEKLSGEKSSGYYGSSMAKGHEREEESRDLYSFINDVEIQKVGFCFFDEKKEFGCSPDGLIGEDGGFETKNAESHVQVDRLENGWSIADHFQQVQGSLLVTGRKWWDLVSYSRGMKPIIIRFERDEGFIKILHAEINLFLEDLTALINKLKA
jgi:hypothetical protein